VIENVQRRWNCDFSRPSTFFIPDP
jgi:hypothetical protein